MSQQPHLKLLELEVENARLKKELLASTHKLQATEEKITTTESKVIKLQDEVLWLRRQLFGHKTERYIPTDPNQLKLDFEGLKLLPQEEELYNEAAQEVISYTRKKPMGEKKKPVRQPLPDHLERVDEVIEPQGVDLTNAIRIGEEITEVMEYIPGKIYVRRIIRPKYALPNDLGIRLRISLFCPLLKVMREVLCWQSCWFQNIWITFPFTDNWIFSNGKMYISQLLP